MEFPNNYKHALNFLDRLESLGFYDFVPPELIPSIKEQSVLIDFLFPDDPRNAPALFIEEFGHPDSRNIHYNNHDLTSRSYSISCRRMTEEADLGFFYEFEKTLGRFGIVGAGSFRSMTRHNKLFVLVEGREYFLHDIEEKSRSVRWLNMPRRVLRTVNELFTLRNVETRVFWDVNCDSCLIAFCTPSMVELLNEYPTAERSYLNLILP